MMAGSVAETTTRDRAFEEIIESGEDMILRKEVAAHIGHEPMTPHEVTQQFPERSKNSIAPRLTELIRMGCAVKKGTRTTPAGNEAYVHHLTETGEKYVKGEVDPPQQKTVSEHKTEVVDAARKFLRGECDRAVLRLFVEDHDEAKSRVDPEWDAGID
jgi:hypothetical protein